MHTYRPQKNFKNLKYFWSCTIL